MDMLLKIVEARPYLSLGSASLGAITPVRVFGPADPMDALLVSLEIIGSGKA